MKSNERQSLLARQSNKYPAQKAHVAASLSDLSWFASHYQSILNITSFFINATIHSALAYFIHRVLLSGDVFRSSQPLRSR